MKRTRHDPPDHVLTPEEQRRRIEEMVLARCAEIRRARLERIRIEKAVAKKKRSPQKLLARCLTCGAYRFLMDAQKRKK